MLPPVSKPLAIFERVAAMTNEGLEQFTEALEEVALDLTLLSRTLSHLEDKINDLVEIGKALLTQRLN